MGLVDPPGCERARGGARLGKPSGARFDVERASHGARAGHVKAVARPSCSAATLWLIERPCGFRAEGFGGGFDGWLGSPW